MTWHDWLASHIQSDPVRSIHSYGQLHVAICNHDMASHIHAAKSSYGQSGLARFSQVQPHPTMIWLAGHILPSSSMCSYSQVQPGSAMASQAGPVMARDCQPNPYMASHWSSQVQHYPVMASYSYVLPWSLFSQPPWNWRMSLQWQSKICLKIYPESHTNSHANSH